MTKIIFQIPADADGISFQDELNGDLAPLNIQVDLHCVPQQQAWGDLLNRSLYGKAPDVAQTGITWAQSLTKMNVLLPYSAQEVGRMGGASVFAPAMWNKVEDGEKIVWYIPSLAWTIVIYYHRDLLEKAHIPEKEAFETAEAAIATAKKLKESGVEIPFATSVHGALGPITHLVASWVWGAGEDFVDPAGSRTRFNLPTARSGIKAFFELYCYMLAQAHTWELNQAIQAFAQGKVGVLISNPATTQIVMAQRDPAVQDHFAATTLPGVPWVGGESLVIWRDTMGYPDHEKACLELITYMVSQQRLAKVSSPTNLPACLDVLPEINLKPDSYAQAIDHIFRTGRSYMQFNLWSMVKNRLSRVLIQIADIFSNDPQADIDKLFDEYLAPLAIRLDLALSPG